MLELYTPDEKEFPYDYTNNSTYNKGEDIIHTNMMITAEDKFRIEEYNSTSIVDKKEDIFISQRILRIKGQLFLAIILLKVIWNQEIKQ